MRMCYSSLLHPTHTHLHHTSHTLECSRAMCEVAEDVEALGKNRGSTFSDVLAKHGSARIKEVRDVSLRRLQRTSGQSGTSASYGTEIEYQRGKSCLIPHSKLGIFGRQEMSLGPWEGSVARDGRHGGGWRWGMRNNLGEAFCQQGDGG
ncbi:hypothetical protein VTO42DRAFT_1223 [Malbranchea cinnamomea]